MAVLTYRRPEMLHRCLAALLNEEVVPADSTILVVDNDSHASARTQAEELADHRVVYLHEPAAGIVAARNAALDWAKAAGFSALAFIDDDEVAEPGWLQSLERTMRQRGATAVFGPVRPTLPTDAPRWIVKFGFFERPRAHTGGEVRWPATNNVLIDLAALAKLGGFRFDEQFSMTGGSDTDFFYRVREKGGQLIWCDEAEVCEEIPPTRASLGWLWRRGVRLGNVSARMQMRRHSRTRVVCVGVARIGLALPLAVIATVRGDGSIAERIMHIPKGFGTIQGVFGRYFHEYARVKT
ncbi:glycosyltransferase family 2 protein [Microbacterium aurantiacum]|uniref:glycosyltransferase family 2 protein n=1 Tax=Microbacterium aurantiacum TaxID=162393 RepID=UPI003F497232